ncbi:9406_t:CDS:2 [Funneliformis caledonium]|uniref:9406_t:CDS:1 n=1 Tax=Funneliformis caledonium TaxID=1117310 RepID=A0A9N8ZDH3_9GLOM|nr:9406_t:CDS:2 [Funneliformis caledonium]
MRNLFDKWLQFSYHGHYELHRCGLLSGYFANGIIGNNFIGGTITEEPNKKITPFFKTADVYDLKKKIRDIMKFGYTYLNFCEAVKFTTPDFSICQQQARQFLTATSICQTCLYQLLLMVKKHANLESLVNSHVDLTVCKQRFERENQN